jgi:hypothetical protein
MQVVPSRAGLKAREARHEARSSVRADWPYVRGLIDALGAEIVVSGP